MKRLKLKLLAAEIEFNWWFIRRERKRGKKLLENGIPFSSKKLLKLNQRFSNHCTKAMEAQRNYERLAGSSCATLKMQA